MLGQLSLRYITDHFDLTSPLSSSSRLNTTRPFCQRWRFLDKRMQNDWEDDRLSYDHSLFAEEGITYLEVLDH